MSIGVSKGKGFFGPSGRRGGRLEGGFGGNVGSCGGKGRRGGSIAGRGGGSLDKRSMKSNDGLGGGGLVVVGAGGGEVMGGGVNFRVSRSLLGEIPGEIMGEKVGEECGGEEFRVDGGAVWYVVPTGRVIVPAGKVIIIVSPGSKDLSRVGSNKNFSHVVYCRKILIQILKIHTDDNVADLLTKAFDGPSINSHCDQQPAQNLNPISKSSMAALRYRDEHNKVGYVQKPTGSDDFAAKMVALVTSRRKELAEQRAQERRDRPMTPAQLRQYMRTYLQEEFDKIQRAVAFTRGLKRDGSPMTNASSKKLKTGDVEVDVEAPSHGVPQEVEVEAPSQDVSREKVDAPSHSQNIPEAQVEVPSNIASKAQQTASSLKKVGTKKKLLGRKGVHTSQSTIPIEEGDPDAEHKLCIKYASDKDYASDCDTPVHLYDVVDLYAVVDWELLPTGLGSINAIYRLDNSRKYFTSLREILYLVNTKVGESHRFTTHNSNFKTNYCD
ncbi:hypothetical protein Tco_0976792 [Tanacetum coccineum]|uniref:Uncharacterized protein n=1 Tax=Tanacetum coccineum TaxID=301880 RepID=A0ABQ5EI92_9ASTR